MKEDLDICFINNSLDTYSEYIENNSNLIITESNSLKRDNKDLNYIILDTPIFNPLYIDKIKTILEKICFTHYKLYNKNKICVVKDCKNTYKKILKHESKNDVFFTYEDKILKPSDVQDIFSRLDEKTNEVLGFINIKDMKIKSNPSDLILNYIPVLPKYTRPSIILDETQTEDILTIYYDKILNTNNSMTIYETYKDITLKNNKYDINKYKSITQIIGSKQGIFRSNILGKRTRLCGRSVITPDIYLNIDEIGIPVSMAKILLINNRELRDNDYVLFIRHPTLQGYIF